jgi:serine phosphatase RsbU (regulator of sigma subunit)
LAVFPDTLYRTAESMILDPGDLLLLITDGVGGGIADGNVLGIERVLDVVRRNRHELRRRDQSGSVSSGPGSLRS